MGEKDTLREGQHMHLLSHHPAVGVYQALVLSGQTTAAHDTLVKKPAVIQAAASEVVFCSMFTQRAYAVQVRSYVFVS
jgi:hypothetical protein